MKLLHLKDVSIFDQLQFEECFLRTNEGDLCIINEGSSPAIVMGISGKPKEVINFDKFSQTPLPIIKRYSGGGTVVVDKNTLFISFICNKTLVNFVPYPEPLMRWTEKIYKNAWSMLDFELKENDYVIGQKKIGGNAQYLTKSRFVHHSTFLWDYQSKFMNLLLHPQKTPSYRSGRCHETFVTKLCNYCDNRQLLIEALKQKLIQLFDIKEAKINEFSKASDHQYRKSTCLISHDSFLKPVG